MGLSILSECKGWIVKRLDLWTERNGDISVVDTYFKEQDSKFTNMYLC